MKLEKPVIQLLFILLLVFFSGFVGAQSPPEIPPDSIPTDEEIASNMDAADLVDFIDDKCGDGCHSSTLSMFADVIEDEYSDSPGANYPLGDPPEGGGAAIVTDGEGNKNLCYSNSGTDQCFELEDSDDFPLEVPELPGGGDGLEPGDFVPLYLQARDSVTAGYSLSVDSEIKNVGGKDRERTIELWVEGEGVVDSTNLDLNADQSKSVSFEWNTDTGDTGDRLIEVRADYNVNDGTPSMN